MSIIVPTFVLLFMYIGLSAALSTLSKISSNKLYNECQQLSGSVEFKQMVDKLSHYEKIPILVKADEENSSAAASWDNVNYAKRLSAMQGFMAEVKFHEKVLEIHQMALANQTRATIMNAAAYDRAKAFLFETHEELWDIMNKELGRKGSFYGLKLKDSVITVQKVLEETLKCAERVRLAKVPNMPKGKTENGMKETSERWINLDKVFKDNLQKICREKMVNKAAKEISAAANANTNAKH